MTVWDDFTTLTEPSLVSDGAPDAVDALALLLERSRGVGANLLDHGGATGGVVDNSAALDAAIDSVPSGGTVVVTPDPDTGNGDFHFTASPSALTKSIRLLGFNAGTTGGGVRFSAPASITILPVAMAADDRRFQIEHIDLSGGLNAITLDAPNYLNGQSYIRDLDIRGPAGAGIKSTTGLFSVEIVKNVNIETPGTYGFWSDGASGAFQNAVVYNKLRVAASGTAGVYLNNASAAGNDTANTFINPIIESNLGKGVHLNQSLCVMTNPYFENNGATAGEADLHLSHTGGSSPRCAATVIGGYFSGTGHVNQAGVRIKLASTFVELLLIHPNGNGGNKINGSGLGTGSSIVIVDDAAGIFSVQSYGGSFASYNPSGLVVAANYPDTTSVSTFIDMKEIGDPGAPPADYVRLWTKVVGSKTALMARFSTGASVQLAIEP